MQILTMPLLKPLCVSVTAVVLSGVSIYVDAQTPSANATATSAAAKSHKQPQTLQTVVVTGTHLPGRTVLSSMQPVDVISGESIRRTGSLNMVQALNTALPAVQFPNPSFSDLSTFVRPFSLRGLAPDDTLMLVDGKPWFLSAPIMTIEGFGQGSQAYDISAIPTSAIQNVQVLRNGASSIYGSNAVAGVVNVILKQGAQGGSATVQYGAYTDGGGHNWQASTNFGIPLGQKGWMRFTLEKGNQSSANRAGVDFRPGFSVLGREYRYGIIPSKTSNALINTQYNFTNNFSFYGFANFSRRMAEPFEFYRYGINSPEPKSPLMALPGFPYPDGFLPLGHGVSTNRALTGGLKGDIDGWHWDTSVNVGGNRLAYSTLDTANFALFADTGQTPTSFYDGLLRSRQEAYDIDVTKAVDDGLSHRLHIAFGTQWMRQSYSIKPGELGSYYASTLHPDAPAGAQGFPGWSPSAAASLARRNLAEYVQLEQRLTDKLTMSFSARHSHYSDFGSNTSWAVSGRYAFNKMFALRGTASTAFRAPSLGQEAFSQIESDAEGAGNALGLPIGIYEVGLIPPTQKIASLLGGTPLLPELSHNYTIGAVFTPNSSFNTSLDLYQVRISNTIAISSLLNIATPTIESYLAANGITNQPFIGIQYFTNAGTQQVRGADLITTYTAHFQNAGTLTSTLSAGYHQNKVIRVNPNPAVLTSLGSQFQRLDRVQLLGILGNAQSPSKIVLNERYDINNWEFGVNITRYGTRTSYEAVPGFDQILVPKYITDINATYFLGPWTLTGGLNNAFDIYPNTEPPDESNFGTFPFHGDAPFTAAGTEVFLQATYHW